MSSDSIQDQIEAASGYESLLVPALFEQWTERVLDAAQIRPSDRVLDVACGTGVLARKYGWMGGFFRICCWDRSGPRHARSCRVSCTYC